MPDFPALSTAIPQSTSVSSLRSAFPLLLAIDTSFLFTTVNLAKIDSYIGTKEEGIERVKTLVNLYRAKNGLRKLRADEEPMFSDEQSEDSLSLSSSSKESSGDDDNLEDDKDEEAQRLTEFNSDIESATKDEKPETGKRELERSGLAAVPKPSILLRFGLLVYRTFLERIREPISTYVHLAQTLFLATVVGIIYLRIGDNDDQKSIDVRR